LQFRSAGFRHVAGPPQPTAASLGRAIRALREERDLTQVDLADAARISTQHLSPIECGRRNPSIAVAARIAHALEMPLSQLILRAERET
jgi:transcriptional regulator with XRE-family HTH domain